MHAAASADHYRSPRGARPVRGVQLRSPGPDCPTAYVRECRLSSAAAHREPRRPTLFRVQRLAALLSAAVALPPQDIPLDVVYEDEHLMVINKVHPHPPTPPPAPVGTANYCGRGGRRASAAPLKQAALAPQFLGLEKNVGAV